MLCWRTCPRDMGWERVSAPRLAHCSASGGGGVRRSCAAAAVGRKLFFCAAVGCRSCAAAADRSTWFASSADRSTCVAACCRRRCCHRKCCPTSSRSSRWYSRCRGPPRTGNHTGSPNCTRSMSLRPRVIRPSNTPTRKPPSAGARPKCCEPCVVGATSQQVVKKMWRKAAHLFFSAFRSHAECGKDHGP